MRKTRNKKNGKQNACPYEIRGKQGNKKQKTENRMLAPRGGEGRAENEKDEENKKWRTENGMLAPRGGEGYPRGI